MSYVQFLFKFSLYRILDYYTFGGDCLSRTGGDIVLYEQVQGEVFQNFKRFLNMERECLDCGFNKEQTDKLLHGQTVNYSGWLHSNENKRNILADNVTAQVIRDEKRFLFLHINNTPITQWFKEQFGSGQSETQEKGIRR